MFPPLMLWCGYFESRPTVLQPGFMFPVAILLKSFPDPPPPRLLLPDKPRHECPSSGAGVDLGVSFKQFWIPPPYNIARSCTMLSKESFLADNYWPSPFNSNPHLPHTDSLSLNAWLSPTISKRKRVLTWFTFSRIRRDPGPVTCYFYFCGVMSGSTKKAAFDFFIQHF